MKQTAVEWLVEKIKLKYDIDFYHIKNDVDQAKEIEKQQIIDAFVECWKANMPDGFECKLSANEYYNQTFKQD